MLLFLSLEEHAWGKHLPTVGSMSLSSHMVRRIEWLARGGRGGER